MDRKTMATLLRWYNRTVERKAAPLDLFYAAYYWKFKKIDYKVIQWNYADYQKKGRIPDFVREYILNGVYPELLRRQR